MSEKNMGVRNYLIEGVSCTGKTSVCDELQRRGYHSIHGDRDLAYWGDPETGEPLDSSAYEHWIWDVDKVRALVADKSHAASFFCGGSRNVDRFIDLLDGVFVLEVDLETLNRRLALRPEDEWGGPASDGEFNARLQHATREGIPENAIVIDATGPLARVVDAILGNASNEIPVRLVPRGSAGDGMSVPESFRTARLEAERLAPRHLAELVAFHRDPRVMAELGGIRDVEQTGDYLSRNLQHWDRHGFGVWMLRERNGARVIGRTVLRFLEVDGVSEVEVGFAFYPDFWGQGFGAEAGEACAAIAWRELQVDSLVGVTTRSNKASQRVLRKIGMQYEREVVVEGTPYRLYRAGNPARSEREQ